jgi:hypothetical protein
MHLRNGTPHKLHGYQIWVGLPRELENMDPKFQHFESGELPVWEENGLNFKLIAGKGFGRQSPLNVYSDLFLLEIKSEKQSELKISGDLRGEMGICIVSGSVRACDNIIEQGKLLVSKQENHCEIDVSAQTHLLIFGGTPFEYETYINWNFVSSDKEKINDARQKWKEKRFPEVPGDNTYVPLPGS